MLVTEDISVHFLTTIHFVRVVWTVADAIAAFPILDASTVTDTAELL